MPNKRPVFPKAAKFGFALERDRLKMMMIAPRNRKNMLQLILIDRYTSVKLMRNESMRHVQCTNA